MLDHWQCLPWSWHIIVPAQCCKRTLARRCSKYWEKKSFLPLHLPVVFVMASFCGYQRWWWLVTLVFAFQVGNLKSTLFPIFNWCQCSELRTLTSQPGLCFEDSLGQPFTSLSHSHLLMLCVQALHSSLFSLNTPREMKSCSFSRGALGQRGSGHTAADSNGLLAAHLPCPRGCPHHCACSLMWDAPASTPESCLRVLTFSEIWVLKFYIWNKVLSVHHQQRGWSIRGWTAFPVTRHI